MFRLNFEGFYRRSNREAKPARSEKAFLGAATARLSPHNQSSHLIVNLQPILARPCMCPCNRHTPHRQIGLSATPRSAMHRCACNECGHTGCHVRIEWSEIYCWICEGLWQAETEQQKQEDGNSHHSQHSTKKKKRKQEDGDSHHSKHSTIKKKKNAAVLTLNDLLNGNQNEY